MQLSSRDDPFIVHAVLPSSNAMATYVTGLLAVEVADLGGRSLAIAPHESFVLSLQYRRGGDALETARDRGLRVGLTGYRAAVSELRPAGHCVTLFALLTPLGVIALTRGQTLTGYTGLKQPLAHLFDQSMLARLEACIADANDASAQLRVFGAWIEQTIHANTSKVPSAVRAARAAMRLLDVPTAASDDITIDDLARAESITRRQLERDMRNTLDVSPRRLAHIARVQRVARLGAAGMPLAAIAADLGYADQAHMAREVRRLTAVTPRQWITTRSHALATAFRQLACNGVVYL